MSTKHPVSTGDDKASFTYQSIIRESAWTDEIKQGFDILSQAGIPLTENNKALYKETVKSADYANQLTQGLNALKQARIRFTPDNRPIYQASISQAFYADFLSKTFAELRHNNIPFSVDSRPFYLAVVKELARAKDILQNVSVLRAAGIEFTAESQHLYQELARIYLNPNTLHDGLKALQQAGIAFTVDNIPLYHMTICKSHGSADEFSRGFKLLSQAGIPFTPDNRALYQAIIINADYLHCLQVIFKTLKRLGIAYTQESRALYLAVITQEGYGYELSKIFSSIKSANIDFNLDNLLLYTQHAESLSADEVSEALWYFEQLKTLPSDTPLCAYLDSAVLSPELFKQIIKGLKKSHYQPSDHPLVYRMILDSLSSSEVSIDKTIAMLNAACRYAENHTILHPKAAGYQQQLSELKTIMESIRSPALACGPLQKRQETLEIENLLNDIATEKMENIHMSYKEVEGYVVNIGNHSEISLSLLLRHANLSHLNLNDETISRLGDKLSELDKHWTLKYPPKSALLKLLPTQSLIALQHYTSEKYKNMNRLFRGEALDEDPSYQWLTPSTGSNNLLANFLSACLVNDATNRLNHLENELEVTLCKAISFYQKHFPDQSKEELRTKTYQYTRMLKFCHQEGLIEKKNLDALMLLHNLKQENASPYSIKVRGEIVSPELIQIRQGKTVVTPTVTSFSVLAQGSEYFHKPGTTTTKLEGAGVSCIVMNKSEGEVLIPQGEQLAYTYNKNTFFASMVRSPDHVMPGGIWSDTALRYAYVNHLSKAYADHKHRIQINGKTVQRPNHGLAHTYRVMCYIEAVIDYFALHAKDEKFRRFCARMTSSDIEWLRVAAAFSITGRESEIAASENLARYDEFRAASRQHLADYLRTVDRQDSAMKSRMLHIVRYMGNPAYEHPAKGQAAINTHENSDERMRRNYLHRLLSIAHKLDLPRCYGPSQFANSMQLCRDLSKQNPEQAEDYSQLIRFTIDLIQAHGDTLQCKIGSDGSLSSCHSRYHEPFEEVSTSLKRVFDLTSTVQRLRSHPEPTL